jgi:endonuclease YncB( thermonuclease family)
MRADSNAGPAGMLMNRWPSVGLVCGVLFALPVSADIVGVASALAGDTIETHGERIRLHGIDAPESGQSCLDAAGQRWRCGQQAALALQDTSLAGAPSPVTRTMSTATGGSSAAASSAALDINGWLVGQGLALAYRRYSRDYVAAEDEAQATGRGVWAGTFEPPWEWRRRRERSSDGVH